MPDLEILLLGPPRILLGGRPIDLKRRKALALMAFLAVSPRSHSRESMATLLWPDTRPARAHADLRHLIWILKQRGVSAWVDADHESLALRRGDGLRIDVAEFRDRVLALRRDRTRASNFDSGRISSLSRAVELYQDHFMSGFGLRDNVAFDEWQSRQEENLRADLAEALETLARVHEERGQFDRAVAYARRWLSLNPLSEPVQRHLMALYGRSGRRAEALELLRTSERLLRNELGLSLARETVELCNRILSPEGGENAGPLISAATDRKGCRNLPAQSTPFVGRAPELAEIRRLLAEPACRLVTLVGPGGSGKTRLALQAAEEHGGAYADGVFFVPLAPVSDPKFMVPAIIDALDVPLSERVSAGRAKSRNGPRRRRALLLDYLAGRHMLLVLDNLEHLRAGAGLVSEIVRSAPGVRMIATSREKLPIACDWVLELDGLPFPPEEAGRDTLDSYGAVELFLQCARRADVRFTPSTEDMAGVVRICRLLRGNPLGIELASKWVRMMSCGDIASEIEASLDFLTSQDRDVPRRHRSLRGVFEHSWGLLPRRERSGFAKLSVLAGTFDREAARDVAGCSLTILSSLVDRSLIRQHPSGDYEIHEVLRQYAGEKLRSDDGFIRARDELSLHYLRKLADLESSIKGPGQKDALERLARDGENIRSAWLWAAERGRVDEMHAAVQSLFLFYDMRSRTQEGAEMFREAARLLERGPRQAGPREKARRALLGLCSAAEGWFLRFLGPSEYRVLVRRGLEMLEPLGPGSDLAFGRILGSIAGLWPSSEETGRKLREAIDMYDAIDDRWGRALAYEVLSYTVQRSDPALALRCAQESLRLRRRLGDRWGISLALFAMGWIAEKRGMPHAARKRYEESLRLRRQMGIDTDGAIECLINLGRIARRTGDFQEAQRLFEECARISREIGNRCRLSQSLTRLGMTACDLGEYESARRHFEEAQPLVEALCDAWWNDLLQSLAANLALHTDRRDEARFLLEQQTAGPVTEDMEEDWHDFLECRAVDPACCPWRDLGLGRLAAASGEGSRAERHLARALQMSALDHDDPTAVEALIEIARLRWEAGRAEEAAELLGLVQGHPALSPAGRTRVEPLLADVAGSRSPSRAKAAMERGRRLNLLRVAQGLGEAPE